MASTTINRYGVPLVLLLLLAISGGVLLGSQRFLADAAAVEHSNRVIASINGLQLNVSDCDATLRGFLLLGDRDRLGDFRQCQRTLPLRLRELAALLRHASEQRHLLHAVESQIAERMRASEHAIARYQHRPAGTEPPTPDQERARRARALSRAIRANTDAMVRSERMALATSARSTAASAAMLRALAVAGIPCVCALTFCLYLLLRREIRRRGEAERRSQRDNTLLVDTVQHMRRTEQDLRTLNRCSRGLQSSVRQDEAIEVARQALERLLGEVGCNVYCTGAGRADAVCVAQWGEAVPCAPSLPLDCCEGLRLHATQILRPDATPPCAHCPVGNDGAAGRYGACLPLIVQGEPLGMIHLSSRDPALLERLNLVEVVAEQLAMALHNVRLRQRLHQQSIHDPLTGLYNRRYLEESLVRELARCERRALPLAVMMLDLDHFKERNDRLGHAGGDALLAAFGQLLGGLVRPEDIACRYGGEEFTVILPGTTAEVAQRRAEQIRAAVAAMQVQQHGQTLPQVTVSIGVAAYPRHGGSVDDLLRCADAALYVGKRNGRNQVTLAAGMAPPRVAVALTE